MNCRNAKKLVFEFIDGLSDEKVRLDLEQHLSECGECEKLASQLTRSMDLLHRAPLETPSENFNWQVRLKLNKERNAIQESAASQGSWLRGWNLRFAASGAAAFAVIVVAGVVAYNAGINPVRTVSPAGEPQVANAQPEKSEEIIPKTVTFEPVGSAMAQNQDRMAVAPSRGPGWLTGLGSAGGGTRPNSVPRRAGAVTVELDSLIRSDVSRMTPEERARYLEECVDLMKKHLAECTSKKP